MAHTVKVTAANVNDVTMTSHLLSGEENTIYGDSGYLSADREKAITKNKSGKHIRHKLNRRLSQSKKQPLRA